MKISIGESLKEHRENAGLTLTQLSRATGISRQNLSRWENNQILPNIDFCVKLAQYYGVSIEELISIPPVICQTKCNTF